MEIILYIIGIYGALALIQWIFSRISDLFKKHREKIRDQAANEVLRGTNVEEEIEGYKRKLAHIRYQNASTTIKQIDGMNVCPKCKEGYLIIRDGKYGKFMGCTSYPKCNYTIKIETAKMKYKESVNEQIVDEIQRAYSRP